ncbi:hypothetical protein [Ornithinimicrobium kibberense]|uniref:hypothetical protein n=1 Tax=Ornithinimicrobium kibberense TaxID=282060 RepID=UPI003614031F
MCRARGGTTQPAARVSARRVPIVTGLTTGGPRSPETAVLRRGRPVQAGASTCSGPVAPAGATSRTRWLTTVVTPSPRMDTP